MLIAAKAFNRGSNDNVTSSEGEGLRADGAVIAVADVGLRINEDDLHTTGTNVAYLDAVRGIDPWHG